MDEQKENVQLDETTALPVETAAPAEDTVVAAEAADQVGADAVPAEQGPEAPADEASEETPAAQFCAMCGTQLQPGQQFCPKCGQKAGEDLGGNTEALEQFNNQLAEKKKKKKKRSLTILIVIVAVIALGIGGKVGFTAIRHSVGLSQVNGAVEDYKKDKIDYDAAAAKLVKLKTSKDQDVVAKAVSAEKTLEKLKDSKDHFQKGEIYKGKADYANAVLHYEGVIKDDPNYEKAQVAIEEILPLWKETIPAQIDALLKDGKTDEAQKLVTTFLEHSDDESISAIGQFINAESNYKKGYLNTAKEIFQKLPATLKVNGVTVQSRVDTLKKYDFFVKLCGKWDVTKTHIETRESWSYGRSYYWYNDFTTDSSMYMDVTCVINKDGTVTAEFSYKFYSYTNYSSISSSVKGKYFTDSYTKKLSLPSDGKISFSFSTGNYTRNDSQKITFNGSSIGLNCVFKYYYSQSCTEYYTSNNTFGKRAEKY